MCIHLQNRVRGKGGYFQKGIHLTPERSCGTFFLMESPVMALGGCTAVTAERDSIFYYGLGDTVVKNIYRPYYRNCIKRC